MNKRQEQQIVDYYSTTDRYIRSDRILTAIRPYSQKRMTDTSGLCGTEKPA